ncbi:hypothetical protein Tco_0875946 [Tanacetum coccineum]|uniref:Uncharacterized protein n=1 Tax=Tanacetum coccineum TaxID=301880 RepID=A0ABQ5BR11_9ASTR
MRITRNDLGKMAEENVPAPTRTDEQLTGVYSFQLDELWFNLNADLLRKALRITPKDSAHPFVPPPADYDELIWEEFIQAIKNFFFDVANIKIPTKKPKHPVIPYFRFTKLIIYYLGEYYKKYLEMVVRKPRQPTTVTGEEGGKKKKALKAGKSKQPASAKQPKPPKKTTSKPTPSKKICKGKRSDHLVDEADEEPQPASKPQVEDDEYNLQRGIYMSLESFQASVGRVAIRKPDSGITQKHPVVEGKRKGVVEGKRKALQTLATQDASTGPSAQPQDDTSANVVYDTSSLADSTNDADNAADMELSTSKAETEILNVDEEHGQAGSDPGKTLESRPLPERVFMEEDQARSNPGQTSSSVPPLSTPIIYLTPPKLVSPPAQEPIFTKTTATTTLPPPPPPLPQSTTDADLTNRVSTLEKRSANFEQKHQLQDKTTKALASRDYKLEHHDLYSKIDKQVNEVVKEAVHNALQALLRERFRDLSEFQMKEIFHNRMFESGSYRSHPDHTTLYEALEASMQRENNDKLHEALTISCKRRRDDQDPPPPPPKDSDRKAPSSSSKQKPTSPPQVNDDPIPDDMHISELEDTEAPKTPEPDRCIPLNDLPETEYKWADALAKTDKDPEENKLLQKNRRYGILQQLVLQTDWEEEAHQVDLMNPEGNQVVHDISKPLPLGGPPGQRKEFYITRHSAPSDRNTVRSHMKILSVVSLKTFSRYGYTYSKEIVLRRANYKEYKISEADFKNLHPSDFEDLYLLNLQVKLNHVSRYEKVHLSTAVNLWTRNIVIRPRVEYLQLGIESYKTKLNLTQLRWDAKDFLFKEDYTIVHKPRAVIYRDRNNQKKMMRETKVHKFSDGTLTRILEKLDYMVKDYELFKFNLGMENRIWTKDDKRRSQEFIKLIERRLKIRRIFRSLESFVSGSLRDIDYRLVNRTE